MRRILLVCLLLMMISQVSRTSVAAQVPLLGPVLAATPAAQDRILLYDIGSDARRELVMGTGWHHVWGFSPDGCRILYTLTESSGLGRAYTAALDGSDARALVTYDALPARQWGIWEPQWSPDGNRIAFTMLRDGFEGEAERQYHIGWVDAAGGSPQFYSVSGKEHNARWSPSGASLVYISFDERVPGADILSTAVPTPDGQTGSPPPLIREADLWVVSADGSQKFRLTNFPVGSTTMPRWSPDEQLIGFVYSPSPSNDTFWMIAAQEGALPTQLTFLWGLALDLTWLPDSTALIAAARDFRDTDENALWRIPLVGNTETDSVLFVNDSLLPHTDYPRFSADGRWLALRSTYTLALVNMEDRSARLLDETLPGNTPPVWSAAANLTNCE